MRKTAAAAGFSLIELLVATSVLSFGMGGMAALMLAASGGMSEAEHLTRGQLDAAAMAATLQLSPIALEHLANPPPSVPLCFEDNACTGDEWALSRYALWRARLARALPGGAGVVCRDSSPMDGNATAPACDGTGPQTVKVFWTEPRREHDQDGGVRRTVVTLPR